MVESGRGTVNHCNFNLRFAKVSQRIRGRICRKGCPGTSACVSAFADTRAVGSAAPGIKGNAKKIPPAIEAGGLRLVISVLLNFIAAAASELAAQSQAPAGLQEPESR